MTDIIQGSDEWFQARLGKVTASKIADLTAKTKTGWGASRKNYLAQLTAEILTGATAESFSNAAMQWGTDTEPTARLAYSLMSGQDVTEVGFVVHPKIAQSGASPDGLVGNSGLLEIKCPNTATHIDTLLSDKVPSKYIKQILWQMACTGRQWCDFVSFDPRLPASMQLFVKRIERDDEAIAELEIAVTEFIKELNATVADLRVKYETEQEAA